MKLSKSVKGLSKAIGFDSIISSIITIALIAGVIIGIFSLNNDHVWEDMIKDSNRKYEYSAYDKKYVNGASGEVEELYKNARILYGYSDIDNLSLEDYSTENTVIYGWDAEDSKRLNNAIEEILQEITDLKNQTSFKKKDRKVIAESLKMIRYFCNNQQVIDKVRVEMKLTSKVSKVDSKLNIYIISDGGSEYFKGYSDKLNSLKNIVK